MRNVLILGAGGQVAGHVINRLTGDTSIRLSLYLRNSSRLAHLQSGQNLTIVEGDIQDPAKLAHALHGQDLVYVNINGQEDALAAQIVEAMESAGVRRLVFLAAIGIYDEVKGAFGSWNQMMIGPILKRYAKAARLIEGLGLDYTILRPTWYTDKDEIDYVLTQKGEPITRTEISRKSVADMIVKLIHNPGLHIGESLGMEKPGSEGDKPNWY